MPTAGRDYPGSYAEFLTWFPDEEACWDYLEWLRWPQGFRCPRCPSRHGWRLGSGRFECSLCGRQASVTAGTIFDKTRTPLRLWFAAAWLVTSQKHGVSALGVQRALGLGSYQTAWAMLHRFRVAMVRPHRERLAGHVEVDEAYVGGTEEGVAGRETETKSIVAIAVEIKNPKRFGRVRMQSVEDVSGDSLIPFVTRAVDPGATIHTDGWPAYLSLAGHGYEHERTVMSTQHDPAHVVMPGVHRIASCSSAGCWAPIRAVSAPSIWTPTSTSSRFASTDAARGGAGCSSTACYSRRSSPTVSPTVLWSPIPEPASALGRSISAAAVDRP